MYIRKTLRENSDADCSNESCCHSFNEKSIFPSAAAINIILLCDGQKHVGSPDKYDEGFGIDKSIQIKKDDHLTLLNKFCISNG